MSLLRHFLNRALKPRQPNNNPALISPLPTGPLYAVGDIHGQSTAYDKVEAAIIADADARGENVVRIVTLGDYIDRGPDSAGMLDRLTTRASKGVTRHCLKGNHEEMFGQFLATPNLHHPWLDAGGRETLASYGLYPDGMRAAARHLPQILASHIPQSHRTFLHTLPLAFETSTHLFCHAGIDPAHPIHAQTAQALLWIRKPFLDHEGPLEKIVVHGHSPVSAPTIRNWQINLDTGAGHGGPLTAARIAPNAPPILIVPAG